MSEPPTWIKSETGAGAGLGRALAAEEAVVAGLAVEADDAAADTEFAAVATDHPQVSETKMKRRRFTKTGKPKIRGLAGQF